MPRIHFLTIVTLPIFRAFKNIFFTLTSDQTIPKFVNYATFLQIKAGTDSLMNTFWSVFFILIPTS